MNYLHSVVPSEGTLKFINDCKELTYSVITFSEMHIPLKFSVEMAYEIKSKYGTIVKMYKKNVIWPEGFSVPFEKGDKHDL